MKLELIEKKEADVNGKHYERTTYSIGVYMVEVDDTTYEDGETIHSIRTYIPRQSFSEYRYYPEISYYDEFFGNDKPEFKVQTTAFGALHMEEFQEFLSAQQEAMEVAKTLTKELIK